MSTAVTGPDRERVRPRSEHAVPAGGIFGGSKLSGAVDDESRVGTMVLFSSIGRLHDELHMEGALLSLSMSHVRACGALATRAPEGHITNSDILSEALLVSTSYFWLWHDCGVCPALAKTCESRFNLEPRSCEEGEASDLTMPVDTCVCMPAELGGVKERNVHPSGDRVVGVGGCNIGSADPAFPLLMSQPIVALCCTCSMFLTGRTTASGNGATPKLRVEVSHRLS